MQEPSDRERAHLPRPERLIDGFCYRNDCQSAGLILCAGCHASSVLWQTTSSMKPWGSRK
jgi:hypothetical protein